MLKSHVVKKGAFNMAKTIRIAGKNINANFFNSYMKTIFGESFAHSSLSFEKVFQDGKKFEIPKGYASGAEPMARKITFVAPEEFIKNSLKEHEFWINGKKIQKRENSYN